MSDSIGVLILLAPPLAPLLLVIGLCWRASAPLTLRLAPLAALPGLALALLAPMPVAPLELRWLLLGSTLGLDETGRIFLLLTAFLWLAAAIYARGYLAADPHQRRFWCVFLLTMSGNLGLPLALDMISFYSFFALMSFAAYGLVMHERTTSARRAATVYLGLVMVGEILLFAGLLLLAQNADSLLLGDAASTLATAERQPLILVLLITAFGIKIGMLPLHVWLPLAHPAAPLPASAVLSGAMIKAGALGLLRLLPLGQVAVPDWSTRLLVIGLLMAFCGVGAGLLQRRSKVLLAYSSISQMGFILLALGLGLGQPESWPLIAPAVLFYSLHHGLAKGTLFLGIGMAPARHHSALLRGVTAAGLLLPALALAGAPGTSGALAKGLLKPLLGQVHGVPDGLLMTLLNLAALGTSLLLLRFLLLLWHDRDDEPESSVSPSMWLGWSLCWGGLLLCGSELVSGSLVPATRSVAVGSLAQQLWPVLGGGLIGTLVWHNRRHRQPLRELPAGDILVLLEALWDRIRRRVPLPRAAPRADLPRRRQGFQWQNLPPLLALRDGEQLLRRLSVAGVLFVLLLLLVLLL